MTERTADRADWVRLAVTEREEAAQGLPPLPVDADKSKIKGAQLLDCGRTDRKTDGLTGTDGPSTTTELDTLDVNLTYPPGSTQSPFPSVPPVTYALTLYEVTSVHTHVDVSAQEKSNN